MTDDIIVFFAKLGVQSPGYSILHRSGDGEIGHSNAFVNEECTRGEVVIEDGYGADMFFVEVGM